MAFLLNAPFPDCRNIEIDLIVEVEAMSHITLREGLKKKHVFYPHFVDKRFSPPPLSTSADFVIILQNINYYPHRLF